MVSEVFFLFSLSFFLSGENGRRPTKNFCSPHFLFFLSSKTFFSTFSAALTSGTPSSRPRTSPGEFFGILPEREREREKEREKEHKREKKLQNSPSPSFLSRPLFPKKTQQLLPLRCPPGLGQLHHRCGSFRRRREEEDGAGSGAGQGCLCLENEIVFCSFSVSPHPSLSSSSIPPTFERNTIPFHPSIAHTTASLRRRSALLPPYLPCLPALLCEEEKKRKRKTFFEKSPSTL